MAMPIDTPADVIWITDLIAWHRETETLYVDDAVEDLRAAAETIFIAWEALGLPPDECPIERVEVGSTIVAPESVIPNPGSLEAVGRGCKCSETDNHYGQGYRNGNGRRWGDGGIFAVTAVCPMHGAATLPPAVREKAGL